MRSTIDEEAFIEAYDEYAEAIFRYCAFRVSDRERARELMQETFANAWEYLRKGRSIEQMRPFLYRIAHNVCVNESLRAKPFSLEALEEQSGFDPVDARSRTPEEDAEAALLLERLGSLRPKDRELLALRYFDGLPVAEIAEALGIPPNTASVRIKRAVEELRKKMAP